MIIRQYLVLKNNQSNKLSSKTLQNSKNIKLIKNNNNPSTLKIINKQFYKK